MVDIYFFTGKRNPVDRAGRVVKGNTVVSLSYNNPNILHSSLSVCRTCTYSIETCVTLGAIGLQKCSYTDG